MRNRKAGWLAIMVSAVVAVAAPLSVTPQTASPTVASPEIEFVKISPGTFLMGCAPQDNRCGDDEKPAHTVKITKAFELGKYPVTGEQWEAVIGGNRCREEANGPAVCVSWNDAERFIKKINDKKDGYHYRFPTEAEWEYAAKSGASWPMGEARGTDNLPMRGATAGRGKPNNWGLYDMEGSVHEWVQDWFGEFQEGTVEDPKGPPTGSYKILRGFNAPWQRNYAQADHIVTIFGFRLARESVTRR